MNVQLSSKTCTTAQTPTLTHFSGIKDRKDRVANMVVGEGPYERKFLSQSRKTKIEFGYKTVLLTVFSNEPTVWKLAKKLDEDFNGAGFELW